MEGASSEQGKFGVLGLYLVAYTPAWSSHMRLYFLASFNNTSFQLDVPKALAHVFGVLQDPAQAPPTSLPEDCPSIANRSVASALSVHANIIIIS